MAKLLKIFPIVEAQGIVATAQPTWGSISDLGRTTQNSSIILSANSNNISVGDTFKISIEIKTNNNQINEYRIFLNFDSTKLKVIDQDPNTPGTQIKLLDQLFSVADPSNDNLVTNDEIRLIAKTPSNNAFQVNRIVAEVEFQAQLAGTTNVSVALGSGKTALIRSNGTTLNFSTNSQIINLLSRSTTRDNDDADFGIPIPEELPDIENETIGNIEQIPIASLKQNEITFIFVFIGIMLILIGQKLAKNKKTKKNTCA